jgi:predicted metal-dependent peptidase
VTRVAASAPRGRNPQQIANKYAHRPELRDLGWWFYMQRNRIQMQLKRTVLRVERRKAELRAEDEKALDWDDLSLGRHDRQLFPRHR